MLITGDSSGAISVWSVVTGEVDRVMRCDATVWSIAVKGHGAGLRIASGDGSHKAKLWSVSDGALLHTMQCAGEVRGIDMDSACQMITTGCSKGEARVWSAETGALLHTIAVSEKQVRAIDLNDDATLVATGSEDKKARVWRIRREATGESGGELVVEVTCGHNVLAVKISPDSRWLATGDAMAKAKVWNMQLGRLEQTMDCGGWVHSVNFADNSLLATGDQHRMASLWDVATGSLVFEMECAGEVYCVTISSDKSVLATGDKSGTVSMWTATTGALQQSMECGLGDVTSVDLSADKRKTATAGIGKLAQVWDAEDGSLLWSLDNGGMVMSVCFSEDADLLATGVVMGKAMLWSMDSGAKELEVAVCKGPVFCVALRLLGAQLLLATGDVTGHACLFDVADGSPVLKVSCGSPVRGLDFSAGARYLATGTAKGDATVWDLRRHLRDRHATPHSAPTQICAVRCGGMVYSVRLLGDYLATGDQHKMAKVWQVSSGTLMQTFRATEVVKRVDLSHDLSLVACGAGNQSLLFDLESGFLVQKKDSGGRVKLAGDKSILVTVDGNGRAYIWSLLDPDAVSFWATMAGHPTALATAARCVPGFELVLYGPSPSGRTMATHAAAKGNLSILQLISNEDFVVPFAVSCVMQRDATGQHAVDYALRNRNGRMAELLFTVALRGPPESRTELVTAPPEALSALELLAKLFPSALMRALCALGVDPYYANGIRDTSYKRAPNACLNCDHNKMAVCGASSPYPSQAIWDQLTRVRDSERGSFTLRRTHSFLARAKAFLLSLPKKTHDATQYIRMHSERSEASRSFDHSTSSNGTRQSDASGKHKALAKLIERHIASEHEREGETIGDEVDVTCGVVGIPYLLLGRAERANIFTSLVKAAESELDLIMSDVMRATIAFKWKAYGYSRWVRQVVTAATFVVCYLMSLFVLLAGDRNVQLDDLFDAERGVEILVGGLLFLVASGINVMYGLQELHEMRSTGPWGYVCSVQNWFDCASCLNVLSLAVLILSGSDLARSFGALGTVLLIPKLAAVSRGHERMSALVTMLGEIVYDMVPFLTLMVFVILVNSFSFELLSPLDSEAYGTFTKSWMSAFALTLGEFERETYEESLLVAFVFHYFTIFVNIVLLNVLIAIISDTYERVEEKGKARGLLMRARLLLEMQDSMPAELLEDTDLFPKWLHVLIRVEDVGSPDIWSGRLHSIKEHISSMEKKIKDTETRSMEMVKNQAEVYHAALMDVVQQVASNMGQLQRQQQQILDLMSSRLPAIEQLPMATDVTISSAKS